MRDSTTESPYHETERHAIKAMTVLGWVLVFCVIIIVAAFAWQDGQLVPPDRAFANFRQSAGEFGEFLAGFAYSIVAEIELYFRGR